jgi:putative transposase
MPRKSYKPEEMAAKLRLVEVLTSQSQSVAEAIRSVGISEVTYYRWRQEYGGLKSDQIRRLKELETENTRLRRAVSDLTLDKLILQEAARESTEPRASPRLHRACSTRAVDLRASRSASIARRSARSRKAGRMKPG